MSSANRTMSPVKHHRATIAFGSLLAAAVLGVSLGLPGGAPARADQDPIRPVTFIGPADENFPTHTPGEVVVRLAPGVNAAGLAEAVGLQLERRLRFAPNTVVLSGIEAGTEQLVASQLLQVPGVIGATRNDVLRLSALPVVQPNDQYLSQQWALPQMGSLDTWGITIGERFENALPEDVVVGVIDSGFQLDHPDLAEVFSDRDGNLLPHWDFVNDRPYDHSLYPFRFFLTHGTNVAGCVAAATNNAAGISSLAWEGVRVLGCHIGTPFSPFGVDLDAAVDAVYYCIDQEVDVINMSFGRSAALPPNLLLSQAISDAYNQGITVVAATGNDSFRFGSFVFVNPVSFPANLPTVIPVGAVGRSGAVASYSNGGPELRDFGVAAPGGDDRNSSVFTDPARAIFTTTDEVQFNFFIPNGYIATQGTSFASPFVAGAAALLISQGAVTGAPASAARVEFLRAVLRETARNPLGAANNDLGRGVIDVQAALRRVTPVIDVQSPLPNETTASFAEPIRARIALPFGNLLDRAAFTVQRSTRRSGQLVTEDLTDLVTIEDPVSGSILFQPDEDSRNPLGVTEINITAAVPGAPVLRRALSGIAGSSRTDDLIPNNIPERAFRFRVQPRVEDPGLKLLSIPYDLLPGSDTLPFLFGGNLVRVARWLPSRNRYAIFDVNGSPQDPEASLKTTDGGVARPPVGLGFWARVNSSTQVQLLGRSERGASYEIPLKPGFNLIGNPYTAPIPWVSVNVRFGNEVLTVSEAATRGLLRSTIWRYRDGRYDFAALPQGELIPWEAHWVRNTSGTTITLIVSQVAARTASAGAAAGAQVAAAVSRGGWRGQITASASGEVVGGVTVGAAQNARDQCGPEDVETPPVGPQTADLRIAHADWGRMNGRYVQDLRGRGAAPQRWELEVETFKARESVKLAWTGFPTGARASLRVEGSAKVHRLGAHGSIQLVADRPGVRRIVVCAQPAPGA